MSKSSFSKTLLAGIIGASVAILFAPKPGKELRHDVKNELDELKEKGKEKAILLVDDLKQSYHESEEELNSHPTVHLTPTAHVDEGYIPSTIEKEEEWLNQVGEQQGVLEKYPDGAFGNPTGLLNDVPKDPLVDPIDVYDRYPFNNSEDN